MTQGAGACPVATLAGVVPRHISRASLFGMTQFPEYLTFLFLSFYILSPPHGGSIGDSYFSPQILPRGALNQLHELVFQSCWVRTSSSPSHFLVF
jgi:hypothetical protein